MMAAPLPRFDHDAAYADYLSGINDCKSLALKHGVSIQAMRQMLRKRGVRQMARSITKPSVLARHVRALLPQDRALFERLVRGRE